MEDADNTIILVGINDERRLIFDDKFVESKKERKSAPLKVSNDDHKTKFLGFLQEPKYDSQWGEFRCLALVDKADTKLFHEKNMWVSTVLKEDKNDHEYILTVNQRKVEEENLIWVFRQKVKKETKQDIEGRVFMFNNESNTISPRGHPDLVLGRRGNAQSKEQKLVDAIRFNKDEETVESLLKEVVEDQGVDNLVEANTTCALAEAVEVNNLKAVNLLMQNGANSEPRGLKTSPLEAALWYERDEIANSIIQSIAYNAQQLHDAISIPMKTGSVKSMIDVLEKLKMDENEALIAAIENGSVECAKELIDRGANLYKCVGDKYPIQFACEEEIMNGPNFVAMILQTTGDFDLEKIQEKHKELIVAQYARLDVTTLSRCAAHSMKNYVSEEEPTKKEKCNPLLKCMILAKEAKKFWRRERRTNPTQARDLNTLRMRLQLCAVAMMEKIHQHDFGLGGDDGEKKKTRDGKKEFREFWKKKSTEKS